MMKDLNNETLKNLTRFIKRNGSLIHLDLTQTNLTEYMLWKIGESLARAKSLVSIHLSGNQGITPAYKKHIFSRIRCRKLPEEHKIGLDIGIIYGDKGYMKSANRKMGQYMNQEKYFREHMQVRRNAKKVIKTNLAAANDDNKLIIERQLGHKSDLPGSG